MIFKKKILEVSDKECDLSLPFSSSLPLLYLFSLSLILGPFFFSLNNTLLVLPKKQILEKKKKII
jgi:hypothetical protein